jgi:predicted aspartyl protease
MATTNAAHALHLPPLSLQNETTLTWLEQFEFITQLHYSKANLKTVFLAHCGHECYALLSRLVSPHKLSDDKFIFSFKDNLDATKQNLREILLAYFRPKHILHHERYKFFRVSQSPTTSISQFISDLRGTAAFCQFGVLLDDLLLTQFINGLHSFELRQRLLLTETLTLDGAVQTAQLFEATNNSFCNEITSNVHAIQSRGSFKPNSIPSSDYTCYCCNKRGHLRKDCRYKSHKCSKCNKVGHIASACRRKSSINHVDMCSSDESNKLSDSYIDCYSLIEKGDMIYRTLMVDGSPVLFLIDTGSPITILPRNYVSNDKIISSTISNIKCYNGSVLTPMGKATVMLTYRDQNISIDVIIVSENHFPLLGCNALHKLNIISISPIICHESKQVMAEIIPRPDIGDSFPKYKPRSLPFSIRAKVEEDIKEKVKQKILVPIDKPIMACPIVPVVKPDGSVRVCGDYSVTANRFIDSEQYALPTLEELSTAMVNCIYFSKLDLTHAYLQLPLSPESQKFTTISTTLGFFNFTRLPFGISSSPRIFQQFIDRIIQLPTVKAYQDDILIGGYSLEDHDKKLAKVLNILESYNLSINQSKSEIRCQSVHFLGFIFDGKGLRPDPHRLIKLSTIQSPSNRKELKSIIGTLQFYSRFSSSFSTTASPLFRLLSSRIFFKWTPTEESALRALIKDVSLSSYLVHYDPNRPVYLTTDASLYGLGAVLSHDPFRQEIIYCASRVLSSAERKYSNIEKEALGVIFGVRRFHQYLAGRHFVIQTDHSPLKYIFDTQKPIPDRISSRLQRWCLVLKSYNFSIFNIKGEEMFLPDLLSRIPHDVNSSEDELVVSYALQESEIPMFKEIQRHTQTSELARIIRFVQKGWPVHTPKRLLPYTRDKYEYTVHNSCLYRGFRIVIPPSLRTQILNLFHDFHPGIAKMRQIMRQFVWWPGMDMSIQKFVTSCVNCASNQSSRTNWQLSSWPEATCFLQRVFLDICFYDKHQYLVLVDSFSNFVDVHNLSSLSSHQIILALKKTFRYFGFPEILVCDNGSQFVSSEFKTFLNSNGIHLDLTPPYHSQSNGKVERTIRTLKLFLNKNKEYSIDNYCMVNNFFPNCNGTIPCVEYLKISPRLLMKDVLLSDKRGITKTQIPDQPLHSTVIPLGDGRTAHSGGIIDRGDKRTTKANPRYFGADFIN